MKLKDAFSLEESYNKPRQHNKSRDIILPTHVHIVQAMVFTVVMYGMWELDCEESWALKNWCFWIVVLEKTLESPLDCKGSPTTPSEGNSALNINWKDWCWSWNSNTLDTWCEELTYWKRPWCWQRLKAGEEGEDRGWNDWMTSPTRWAWVWVNSGSSDGQWSLVCCSPWGRKEPDTTEQLNSTELPYSKHQ